MRPAGDTRIRLNTSSVANISAERQPHAIYLATLVLLSVATVSFAQVKDVDLAGASKHFKDAERKLRGMSHEEYQVAREQLASQALAVAQKDPGTKDAEELFHWILSYRQRSPTVGSAVEYLIKFHVTSPIECEEAVVLLEASNGVDSRTLCWIRQFRIA